MSGPFAREGARPENADEAPIELRADRRGRQRVCVLVLGMHRSGTSALTRVLSLCGAALPATLNRADPGNASGYWESERLIEYDDALLAELQSDWKDWRSLDASRLSARRRAEIVEEIGSLLKAEFDDASLIVVKEPRLCRFASLAIEAIEQARLDCRVILAVRSPLEVIDSLQRRDSMPKAQAALLWLRHTLDAEIASRQRQRAILSFEGVLQAWEPALKRASEQLRIAWAYDAADIRPQVEAFLKEERRHHRSKLEEVMHDPMLRRWLGEAYSSLLVLEQNPQASAALAVLDRIRAEFDGAAPVLDRLLVDERNRHSIALDEARAAWAAQQHAELSAARSDEARALAAADELRVRLTESETTSRDLEAALELAQRDRSQAVDLANALREQLEEANLKLEEVRASLSAAEADAEASKQHAATLQSRLAESETAIVAQSEALDAAQLELDRGRELVVALRNSLEGAESTAGLLKEDLSGSRQALAEAEDLLQIKEGELRHAYEITAAAVGKIEALGIAMARANAEAEQQAAQHHMTLQTLTRLEDEASRMNAAYASVDLRARELAEENARLGRERDLVRTIGREQEAASALREQALRAELAQANANVFALRESNAAFETHLRLLLTSTSWRVTRPLRGLKRLFTDSHFRDGLFERKARRAMPMAPRSGPLRRWTMPWAMHAARGLLTDSAYRRSKLRRAVALFARKSVAEASIASPVQTIEGQSLPALDDYDAWLRLNAFTEADLRDLNDALALRAARTPKISVLMPVYNSDPRLLREAVESVHRQIYENWELCLVDDCSSSPEVAPLLDELARRDKRIKVARREVNGGIAECTNSAAALATGEILAFVDHDDLITVNCLAELALYYADHANADVVYSDDDKISMEGKRFAPQFKPDFAPSMLLGFMYMGHIFSVRRSLFQELGGFRAAFDGSQDFDFALRATEQARHVGHVPKVLYSWRVAPGSTAAGGDAKPASFEAGKKAVQEALARRRVSGVAVQPQWARNAKCGIFGVTFPDHGPEVTIIIPTKDRLDLLRPCLQSLFKTSYRNYRIMIVDNESTDPVTLAYLDELKSNANVQVERIANKAEQFSYAYINNEAVRRATTDFVLLLNNDTAVRNPRWLSQMMGWGQMPHVGAVGAKLFFSDETIQHAGIVYGLYNGLAGPAFRNEAGDSWGYLNSLKVTREYSAVTAACLLIRKSLFESIGGLDEERFNVAYNDVDLCYRLVDAGYRCVCCAEAELFHYEGKSRGARDDPRELAAFRAKYLGRRDAWYNDNLSLDDEHSRIAVSRPERRSVRRLRAVMVSHNLEHEGAPNSMLELAVGLKTKGVLSPVVLSPRDGPLRAAYEAAGIPIEIIANPISDVHEAPQFRQAMAAFARKLRSFSPEVAYANTLQTFWAVAGATAAEVPSVWNVRESEPWSSYFDYLSPTLRPFAYEALNQAYAAVFVADATRAAWAPAFRARNSRVIHNGLDLRRLAVRADGHTRSAARASLGLGHDDVALVLLGTVCDRKGQRDLVEAAPFFSEAAARSARIFIVGDRPGPYSEQLHAKVLELPANLRDRLAIVPETSEPYRYLSAGDIAVCTSRVESYPRVILEAMAFGLPIVTTSVFGIAEQVRDGVNALFYEQADTRALAGQLEYLILNRDERTRMGENSGHVLRCLTQFDEMLERYAAVFRQAVSAPTQAPVA